MRQYGAKGAFISGPQICDEQDLGASQDVRFDVTLWIVGGADCHAEDGHGLGLQLMIQLDELPAELVTGVHMDQGQTQAVRFAHLDRTR